MERESLLPVATVRPGGLRLPPSQGSRRAPSLTRRAGREPVGELNQAAVPREPPTGYSEQTSWRAESENETCIPIYTYIYMYVQYV